MKPHLFKHQGHWRVRAICPDVTLGFAIFEGAAAWAKKIHHKHN